MDQNKINEMIVKQEQPTSLQVMIEKSAKELGRALPEHMRPERLVRIALTCMRQNPQLNQVTPQSFLGALFTSAQLGIEPIAGRAYILPFKNNKKDAKGNWVQQLDAQFVMGYKGLAELFYRHEKSVQLDWGIVHENDDFSFEYGSSAKLSHKPKISGRGNVIAYYVMATLSNGGKPFLVMSKEDCISHGMKHSKTFDNRENSFYKNSPWATNTDAMCLKTVLIQLMKLLPLSIELQKAVDADESSREFKEGMEDIIDIPSETNWTKPEEKEETTQKEPTQNEPVNIDDEELPQEEPIENYSEDDLSFPPKEEKEKPAIDGAIELNGFVKEVRSKKGIGKNGKEWIKYGVWIGDIWASTFSNTDAEIARQAIKEAREVFVLVIKNQWGYELKQIGLME